MFYHPQKPLGVHGTNLPHWQQDSSLVFMTWRLADSVPATALRAYKIKKDNWLLRHPKPWSPEIELEFHKTFSAELENWLDQGHGGCILRRREAAQIVADALMHFDGDYYEIDGWVIMPNHVHILVQLIPSHPLEKVVHSWKSFTGLQLNKLYNTTGKVWQTRYYDTLVRSEKHHWKIRRYIEQNPTKAKLTEGEFLLHTPWLSKHGDQP